MSRSDVQIQQDVVLNLSLEPGISSSNISASVRDGIVTLRGRVAQFFEKSAAETVVWRIPGVRAVADEIEVKPPGVHEKSDAELAHAALQALEKNLSTAQEFRVTVDKGWITLEGETNWDVEKMVAQKILKTITGVAGITSNVIVRMKERRKVNRPSVR